MIIFDWIHYISSAIVVGIIFIITGALNTLFGFLIRFLSKRKYKKTASVEKTMYSYSLLNKYIRGPLLMLTVFVNTLAIMVSELFQWAGKYEIFFVLVIVLCLVMVDSMVNTAIMHKFLSDLRGTSQKLSEKIRENTLVFILVMTAMLLMIGLIRALPGRLGFGVGDKYIKATMVIVLYMAFSYLIQPLFMKILKAYPMEDGDFKEELKSFMELAGADDVELFIWETKAKKHANALVSGLKKCKIYICDYMIENFEMDEIKSILAHEAGHIANGDIKTRSWILVIAVYLYPVVTDLSNLISEDIGFIPFILGHGLLYFGVYFIYFKMIRLHIYRKQEMRADEYVISCGIDPLVFISALSKLSSLNHMVSKFNKVDEKMMTHPSTQRRIDHIKKICNVEEKTELENERLCEESI